MNLKYHFLIIAGGLVSVHALFIDEAYAYLEPNSLSLVAQAMLGALVGVGIALKVYWEKIKFKFSRILFSRSQITKLGTNSNCCEHFSHII